jgi:membrane-associated protease RseP (regulator of RpoE activity)
MSLILTILVILIAMSVHEFGHFIPAKLFGCRVYEYSIGAGPALIKKKWGETIYSIRPVPIAAYVYINQDDLNGQPYWKTAVILLGGVTGNILLAYLGCYLLFTIVGYSPIEAIKGGFDELGQFLSWQGNSMLSLLKAPLKSVADLEGPIGIIKSGSKTIGATVTLNGVKTSWLNRTLISTIVFSNFINVALAYFNLLPVPVLDGGRFLVRTIEAIIRRKLPEKVTVGALYFGGFMVLGLFMFTTLKDVANLFIHR